MAETKSISPCDGRQAPSATWRSRLIGSKRTPGCSSARLEGRIRPTAPIGRTGGGGVARAVSSRFRRIAQEELH